MQLSQRLKCFSLSPTLALTTQASELRAQGVDVISFAAGEPDFNTPKHIQKAAQIAMDNGQTKYTAVGGSVELKKAIIKKLKRDNQLNYDLNEITVNCGGKHSLFNAFFTILNDGDEVIIPAPYWVSYLDQVKLAGGVPVVVDCPYEDGFLLSAERLKNALTAKTRIVIINSPSNPTGACFQKQQLAELASILKEYPKVIIVSDDIYEKIIYNKMPFMNLLIIDKSLRSRFLLVNGVSKCYSMTGWRIGYLAGPEPIIKASEALQSQITSNPCSIAQAAALEALTADQGCVEEMRQAFAHRRNIVSLKLRKIPEIRYREPLGAFYAFPDVAKVYKLPKFKKKLAQTIAQTKENSQSKLFCKILLEQAAVVAVPGVAFGNDFCFRISFALAEEKLIEGLDRIEKTIADLR